MGDRILLLAEAVSDDLSGGPPRRAAPTVLTGAPYEGGYTYGS